MQLLPHISTVHLYGSLQPTATWQDRLASPVASIISVYIGIDSWIDAATHRSELITRCTHAAIYQYFECASQWLTVSDCDLAGSFGESSGIDHIRTYRDRLLDRCSHSQTTHDHSACSCRYCPHLQVCISITHCKRLRPGRFVWRFQ